MPVQFVCMLEAKLSSKKPTVARLYEDPQAMTQLHMQLCWAFVLTSGTCHTYKASYGRIANTVCSRSHKRSYFQVMLSL